MLNCPLVSPETGAGEVLPRDAKKGTKRTPRTRLPILSPSRSYRLGARKLFICLIAVTIMTQLAKTEKPTGVFYCAFLAEKCISHSFFGAPKKSAL
jgi:hypothetical protein